MKRPGSGHAVVQTMGSPLLVRRFPVGGAV